MRQALARMSRVESAGAFGCSARRTAEGRSHFPADPYYIGQMTDATTRAMPTALPPSEAELAEWQALSREEQLARYRKILLHPDCQRISNTTMNDVRAEAQRRAAHRG